MKKGIVNLPNSELEIMMAIWELNRPVTRSEIEETISTTKWAPTTILKFLSRLTEKGFITCSPAADGRKNIYTAIITEKEYLDFESSGTFGRFAGHSLGNLIVNLYENNSITDADLDELEKFIEEKRNG